MADDVLSLVEEQERLINDLVSDLVDEINDGIALFGPRPHFYKAGDRLGTLEGYLMMRDNPDEWSAYIQNELLPVLGPDDAVFQAWATATELERMLDRAGGPEAVARAVHARRMREVERDFAAWDRTLALPKADVRPPAPALDELDLLLEDLGVTPQQMSELLAMSLGASYAVPESQAASPLVAAGTQTTGEMPPLGFPAGEAGGEPAGPGSIGF